MKSEVCLKSSVFLSKVLLTGLCLSTLVRLCSCLLGYERSSPLNINFLFLESPIIFQNICSKRHLISSLHPQNSLDLEKHSFKSPCTYSVGRELTVRYPSPLIECQFPKQRDPTCYLLLHLQSPAPGKS